MAVAKPAWRHASARVVGPCGKGAFASSMPSAWGESPVSIDATTACGSELDARFRVNSVSDEAQCDSASAGCDPPHGASDLADVLPRITRRTERTCGGL